MENRKEPPRSVRCEPSCR